MTEVNHETFDTSSAWAQIATRLNSGARQSPAPAIGRGQRFQGRQTKSSNGENLDWQTGSTSQRKCLTFPPLIISWGQLSFLWNCGQKYLTPLSTAPEGYSPPAITDNHSPSNNGQGQGYLKFPLRTVIAQLKADSLHLDNEAGMAA